MTRTDPTPSPIGARWSASFPIRRLASFEIHGATRVADGRACTVVLSPAGADAAAGAAALGRFAAAHREVTHPFVARTLDEGVVDGRAFVELDCAAVADGTEVIRLLPTLSRKIPYAAADAFIHRLREGLQAGHALGRCVGRFSGGNVLFDADGHWSLIGFGHNVAVLRETGVVDASVAFYSPPEVAAGIAEPSPQGDYVALVVFARSLVSYVDVAGAIAQVLRGVVSASTHELAELLHWVERRVIGEMPAKRATVEEAVDVANRIRRLTGTVIDPEGFARYVAAALRETGLPPIPQGPSPEPCVLTFPADASWVEVGSGKRHTLAGAHRRLFLAFVRRRQQSVDGALGVWELFEAGWPGESASPAASVNRVYVALNRLRARGLRVAIERFDEGWRLAPSVVLRFAPRV